MSTIYMKKCEMPLEFCKVNATKTLLKDWNNENTPTISW